MRDLLALAVGLCAACASSRVAGASVAAHGAGLRAARLRAPTSRSAAVRASSAEPDEDWRAVRARLVAQEAKEQAPDGDSGASGVGSVADGGYVYETPLIEQGSVILASTQQRYGFGLSQQYFHKCVILVLSHGPDFTRGLILNRPTPFTTDDGWPLSFGGDVQSLAEERASREVTCLHTLESAAAEAVSARVLPGIHYTSFDAARELVAQGHAAQSDFWAFCGYAGWGGGQLQDELDRKSGSSWRLASTGSAVLLRELIGQRAPDAQVGAPAADDDCGIETWGRLMRGLGHGPGEVDSSAGGFADRMLREWVRVNLRPLAPTPALTKAAVAAAAAAAQGARSPVSLEPGAVLRTAPVVSAFTLGKPYLHKALLLLLRTGSSGTVGVVLNRLSRAHVSFPASGTKRHVLFGGQLAMQDESILWLHRNPTLPGERVGKSGLFRVSADAAAIAMAKGLATERDFLCVHGFVAWGPSGLEREVAAGLYVPVVDAPNAVPWERIWALPDPAAEGEGGAEGSAGRDLWEAARAAEPAEILGGLQGEVADGDAALADLALLKWVDTFLS